MYFSLIHCSSRTLGRGGVDRNDVADPKALGGFDLWQAVCPQECCCLPSRVISFITRHGLLKYFSSEADVLMVAAWLPTGLLQVSKKQRGPCLALHKMILNHKDYLVYIKWLMNTKLSCAGPLNLYLHFFCWTAVWKLSQTLWKGLKWGFEVTHTVHFHICQ